MIRVVLTAALLATVQCIGASGMLARGSVPCLNYIAHGDSITYGFAAATNYSTFIWSMLSNAPSGTIYNVQVRGIPGQDFQYQYDTSQPDLTVDATNNVDRAMIGGVRNVLVIFAGTNGLFLQGNSAATEYSYFTNYFAGRIAAGWVATNIAVCTMLPRQSFSETIRGDYNTRLVNGAATLGYQIVRLDQNPNIGCDGCQNNATYFVDTIHPTTAGQAIIAGLVYAVLFP